MQRTDVLLTEDVILYLLYEKLKSKGAQFFFKLKHNISPMRDWYYAFGPDVDLLEVRNDGTIVGYEAKGQQKGKPWPARYEGLDEAMAYLELPYISKNGRRLLEGGVMDEVYLVHVVSRPDVFSKTWLKIFFLTPIGLAIITPQREFFKILQARKNPVLNIDAKQHFLQHLNTLSAFNKTSRTFRSIKRKADEYYRKSDYEKMILGNKHNRVHSI